MAILKICGLEYGVVFATAEEAPCLLGKDGYTDFETNTIYVHAKLAPSRSRDTLVHEVCHAFIEGSGIGSFLSDRIRGDYEKFEETLVRLLSPQLLRLIDENGRALLEVPKTKPIVKTAPRGRAKTTRGKR